MPKPHRADTPADIADLVRASIGSHRILPQVACRRLDQLLFDLLTGVR